jgi:NAD(P)-dependent dehydrogenase (short-subunit alcohol dehydrogenase family)
MFTAGVRASFVSSRYGAPLVIEQRGERPGLIVNTIALAFGVYLGNVLYDTAKAATARMAFGMAHELRARRFAAVALALALGHLGVSESPRYGGHAIVALASDPDVLSQSGLLLTAGRARTRIRLHRYRGDAGGAVCPAVATVRRVWLLAGASPLAPPLDRFVARRAREGADEPRELFKARSEEVV